MVDRSTVIMGKTGQLRKQDRWWEERKTKVRLKW